jgi:hypothetical protein
MEHTHAFSLGAGFSCPNNLLNLRAFMHEELPKYAHFIPNINIDFYIILGSTDQNLS